VKWSPACEDVSPEAEEQPPVGVGWLPACKDVSPEAEECPPMEAVGSNVTENTGLCVIVICEV
jgi:hypothetical protein